MSIHCHSFWLSTATGLALSTPPWHINSIPAWMQRKTHGPLAEHGGARRLQQDISPQLKQAIRDGEVHNVIPLIGDGMGDSEIAIAHNDAEGAGNDFQGIDAWPITGQYTHGSLDKVSGNPAMSLILRHANRPAPQGPKRNATNRKRETT